MAVTLNIQNNQFLDNSSVIRYSIEIDNAQKGLNSPQNDEVEKLILAMNELRKAMESNNKPTIAKVITDFAAQFTSNTFANIASSALFAFVKGFLP